MVLCAPRFGSRGAETPFPAYQPGLLSPGFPELVSNCTSDRDRMSRMCSDLVIRKVVIVTSSSMDPLGVRRESWLELFGRKV